VRHHGDAVIIGAGIIGLSIAFELAGRGASVQVFDAAEPAKAASWAAAGMLAPRTEALTDTWMQALCEESLALYPRFAAEIAEEGGIDPHLRLNGILHAAFSADALERLQRRSVALCAQGYGARILSREDTLLAEPALGKRVAGALLVEGEGQVDNRRLGRALAAACRSRGVRLKTDTRVLRVDGNARCVLGVKTELGYVGAGAVINAAGAWAARLEGVPQSCVPQVRPIKGEMLAIEIPVGFMRHTTWVENAYLVPRADGRLLVGASSVDAGFDARVTAGGIERLLRSAIEAAPALGAFTITETWAGLRPATPDERPVLGETALAGYYLACGHYRNGILLAPVTARILADAVCGTKAAAV
jgi:glycine oxidase